MASIGGGGGGHGGKKTVDQEIPLVPFIDLLLCCVMFLLVTAVWNQLARIEANQNVPSTSAPSDEPPPEERDKLTISITSTGYLLSSTAGAWSSPSGISTASSVVPVRIALSATVATPLSAWANIASTSSRLRCKCSRPAAVIE